VTAAFIALLAWIWPERHWQRNLTSGVDVFAHVWVQALDTLSNFCDNNNIQSAIQMKLSFFDKCDIKFQLYFAILQQILTFKFPKVVQHLVINQNIDLKSLLQQCQRVVENNT